MQEYSKKHPLFVFIRAGCAYLLQVRILCYLLLPFNPQNHFSSTQICRAERELFECAFPLESGDASSALWSLMEPLGSILHDTIRPQYIQLNDIYTLAELVDVLSGEVSTVQK